MPGMATRSPFWVRMAWAGTVRFGRSYPGPRQSRCWTAAGKRSDRCNGSIPMVSGPGRLLATAVTS